MANRAEPSYSAAAHRYLKNVDDIGLLLGIHALLGGSKPGRRRKLDALNKAGIVLICAFWEAYCEDLADEALTHLVKNARTPDVLPEPLKKIIASELKADKHELSPWKLAGDGWRKLLLERAAELRAERNRALNTPKADQIRDLFARTIGIPDVTAHWHWKRTTVAQAKKRLDDFVALRGDIAHRGASSVRPVWKKDVATFAKHVTRLVAYTEAPVTLFMSTHQSPGLPVPSLSAAEQPRLDRLGAMKRALRSSTRSA